MEFRETTIDRLRKRLDRDPTEEEIKSERKRRMVGPVHAQGSERRSGLKTVPGHLRRQPQGARRRLQVEENLGADQDGTGLRLHP